MKQNTAEYRQWMKEAIERLRSEDPAKLAELQKRARDEDYDERCRVEETRKTIEDAERSKFALLSKPVIVGLPDIDLSGVRGMVAYKTWQFDGRLKSTAMHYYWKELNFADRIPDEHNQSGFYCIKMTSLGVMTTGSSYFSNYAMHGVSGFVELLGKVVEHTDGVLRAEIAKLICLFVVTSDLSVVNTVRSLCEYYPFVPRYVLNPGQLADVVIREVLRQKYFGGD